VYADGDQVRVIRKVSLKKEKGTYMLCIDFHKNVAFTPRIHILSNGAKVLLSFKENVSVPKAKQLSHNIIKGCFFEKFSPASLMFVVLFKKDIAFTEKKYSKHAVKIKFKINKKPTIVVDAGHGGKDLGESGINGNYEKDISLVAAIELRNILIKSGKYSVILSRDKDKFISFSERIAKANAANADFLISIHVNGNSSSAPGGVSFHTLSGATNLNAQRAQMFSLHLAKYVPSKCRAKDRRCKNEELGVLHAKMPAICIKLGNIASKTDAELLYWKIFRDKLNYAILYALNSFFEKGK
jgi:N-acetylmuramoyl-L-alanine amidase